MTRSSRTFARWHIAYSQPGIPEPNGPLESDRELTRIEVSRVASGDWYDSLAEPDVITVQTRTRYGDSKPKRCALQILTHSLSGSERGRICAKASRKEGRSSRPSCRARNSLEISKHHRSRRALAPVASARIWDLTLRPLAISQSIYGRQDE